jgi:hypothetical protein
MKGKKTLYFVVRDVFKRHLQPIGNFRRRINEDVERFHDVSVLRDSNPVLWSLFHRLYASEVCGQRQCRL